MKTAESGVLAHAAITVPRLEEAIDWYEAALGLRRLPQTVESAAGSHPRVAEALAEVYDERCEEVRVAFLVDERSVAIELFEFNRGVGWSPPGGWTYDRAGFSHVGFQVADLERTVERIEAAGGRRRSRTMSAGGDWSFCFCEDPYETVLELQTHSQEEMYGEVEADGA
jgi:catechol 2,3-dioxygenase-like lactoylglutathione lyase family enzyme